MAEALSPGPHREGEGPTQPWTSCFLAPRWVYRWKGPWQELPLKGLGKLERGTSSPEPGASQVLD